MTPLTPQPLGRFGISTGADTHLATPSSRDEAWSVEGSVSRKAMKAHYWPTIDGAYTDYVIA